MPHRMRRRDKRREWMLLAVRLFADAVDADEKVIGLSMATADGGGVVAIYGIAMGDSSVTKAVVTDEDAIKAGAQAGAVVIPRLAGGQGQRGKRNPGNKGSKGNGNRHERWK